MNGHNEEHSPDALHLVGMHWDGRGHSVMCTVRVNLTLVCQSRPAMCMINNRCACIRHVPSEGSCISCGMTVG